MHFDTSMEFVFHWEGGYVNDPKDPGGETKYGISKRWHPEVDIKRLTADEAKEIYYKEYWVPAGCEGLPMPLCAVVFDTAVNMGVGQAKIFLRKTTDPHTYIDLRKAYYDERVKRKPDVRKFYNGWMNRLKALRHFVDENTVLTVPSAIPETYEVIPTPPPPVLPPPPKPVVKPVRRNVFDSIADYFRRFNIK